MGAKPPTGKPGELVQIQFGKHTGYCVDLGGSTMVVPLKRDRALTVAAPCPVAAAFAEKALARLPI